MRRIRGATALETALVLPVLFAFLFGTADWCWLYFEWLGVRSAALEGVRLASGAEREGELVGLAAPAVQQHLRDFLVDPEDATITAEASTRPYGRVVTVTVTTTFTPLFGWGLRERPLVASASAPWMGWVYQDVEAP